MNQSEARLVETAVARAAALDAFFAAVARGDAEGAYSQMSSVFRMLFTLPTFRMYLEQETTLTGYRAVVVEEERVDQQPSDLAILDLASFGDSTPDESPECERVIDEYLTSVHVGLRGTIELAGGERARFQAAMLLEGDRWRVKGYQLEEWA
jgi:hypothetical protein